MRGALLVALLLTLRAPALHGHAYLVSSEPAAQARLAAPPAALRLAFSEAVRPVPRGLVVIGPDGRRRVLEPRQAEPHLLEAPFAAGAAGAGVYRVEWRAVSLDGHLVEGAFSFELSDPELPAAAESPEADPPAAHREAHEEFEIHVAPPWGRWVTLLGLALLTGGAALLGRFSGTAPLVGRLTLIGALLLLLGAAGEFLAYSTQLAGGGSGALDSVVQRSVFGSRWGWLWVGRVLLIAAALFLIIRVREGRTRPAPHASGLLALAALASLAIASASHAVALRPAALFVLLDAVHRFSAALWVGGLAVVGVLLWRRIEPETADALVRSFSFHASWAVPLAVLTGLAPVVYRFWPWPPGLGEAYVRVLAVKLLVLAGALALGGYHRWRVRTAAPPGAAEGGLATARATLALEAVLAVAVLVLAGLLAATPPPA